MAGFYHPLWLIGLALIPVAWYFYQHSLKIRKKQAMEFSRVGILKTALGDSGGSKRPKYLFILMLLAIGLLFTGLADPHIPLEQTKEGVNVVLVVDVSGSMQATDYQPTRLDSAKSAAEKLIRNLDPKDYCGIVVFESGATTAGYLSPDKDRIIEKLFGIMPRTGQTALGDGLSLGIDMADSIPNRKKVVVLLSDGVSNAGIISPAEAQQFATDSKVQVFTVGLGSEEPAVLGYDWFGNPQYASLDEKTLQDIAENTGGRYFRSVDDKTLSEIYSNLDSEIKREKEETSIGWILIVMAIITLFAEIYFRYGKRRIIQ